MPVSVFHASTMTTPDDPAYELRPSHWNSEHAVSVSLTHASEIFGAFSNDPSYNVTFSTIAGNKVVGSANVTAAPSPVNVTGANGSSVNAQTIAFSNSNGMTLGVSTAANGATVTGSYTVPTQSQQPMAASANNGSFTANTLSFSNANGVTFATSAGSAIVGSVATTYRASNDAIGLNSAVSNVTATINSSGLSLDARGYAGTATAITGGAAITLNSAGLSFNGASLAGTSSGFTGANISASITHNTAGLALSMSVAAPGGGAQTGISGIVVSNTTYTSGTVSFSNANGISFGSSAGQAITASYTVPSTAGLISAVGVTGQNGNFTTTGLSFSNANGVSFGTSAGSAITASHNGLTSQSNQALSAANGSFTFQTAQFSNANGVSFVTSAGSAIAASVETSYAASNHSHGNPTLALTNLSGTTASASNGFTLSLSAAAGGGVNPVASASNGSFSFTTLGFSNANNVTFGTSAGSIITASVAAPGAAAENNWVNLLGANTAGNTTASGSTIGYSGINLTLSGTNGSVVNISAPATSSLAGVAGVSISTNGSTISVFPNILSNWDNIANNGYLSNAPAQQANSLVSVNRFRLDWPVVASNVVVPMSVAVGSQTNNSSAFFDVSVSGVVYSRNVSTLSSLFSWSRTATVTWSSNGTGTIGGVNAITGTFAGTTMTPGDYWMALHVSTANTATGGAATTALGNTVSIMIAQSVGSAANLVKLIGGATNNSQGFNTGVGVISTGATRASIAFSDYTVTGTRAQAAPYAFGLRNQTFQL